MYLSLSVLDAETPCPERPDVFVVDGLSVQLVGDLHVAHGNAEHVAFLYGDVLRKARVALDDDVCLVAPDIKSVLGNLVRETWLQSDTVVGLCVCYCP